jgi:hypothetical protein
VVEHQRGVEELLGYGQRAPGIARKQDPLGQIGGRTDVDGSDLVDSEILANMARRRTTPKELPDAVRDAVDRTVQATVGSADRGRSRAQGAIDDVVDTVTKGGRSVLPATQEDVRAIRTELRAIARRLDAIEERLPQRKRSSSKKS